MTQTQLGDRIIALTGMLYHISASLLPHVQDREDAVQNAIEKAWRKGRFLSDPDKLKPWLARVLINECYNLLRRKKREVPTAKMPETALYPDEGGTALQEALSQLEENLRLPLVLHYMEGFSIAQIASALKWPQGTVLSRMDRGRKQLKQLLKEEDL